MVQGIMGLNSAQPPQAEGASPDAANALSGGFNNLSPDEITKLQELQDDLSELSPDKLKVLEQIIQFLKKNQDRYDDAVRMLVSKGVLEAGDLPPDYIPAFFEILEKMVQQAMSGGREQFAKGGIASLRKKAKAVQKAGTGGDKILAHINPREAAMLQATRGGGMNPNTGLPEYGFFDDIGNFLKQAAPVVLPVALGFMGVPPVFAGAIGSGVGALINGASPDKALQSALMGGVTGAAFSGVQGMMGGKGFMEGVSQGFKPATQGMFSDTFGGYQTSTAPTTAAPSQGGPMAGANAPPAQTGAQPGMLAKATDWMSQHPYMTAGIAGLGGAALASAMQPDQVEAPSLPPGATEEQIQRARFPAGAFTQRVAPRYNFVPTMYAAQGGELDARIGGHLSGPGTGTSDSIPARLSDGEFVMTAKAVRGAGNGSRKAGAKKMYALMHQFEKRA
jgi:hypothetical protein